MNIESPPVWYASCTHRCMKAKGRRLNRPMLISTPAPTMRRERLKRDPAYDTAAVSLQDHTQHSSSKMHHTHTHVWVGGIPRAW